jgi:hypothetical protein
MNLERAGTQGKSKSAERAEIRTPSDEGEGVEIFGKPEIPKLLSEISRQIREHVARPTDPDRFDYSPEADHLAASFGAKQNPNSRTDFDTVKKMGSGSERLAYEHTDERKAVLLHMKGFDIERVLGIWDQWKLKTVSLDSKADRAKFLRQFDLIKILHALYPDQIADIHDISNRRGITVRERVHGEDVHRDGTHTESVFHRRKFDYLCRKLGLRIDPFAKNFIKDDERAAVYIDNIYEFKNPVAIADLLQKKIEHADNLTAEQKSAALLKLERFRKLGAVTDEHP